MNRGPQAFTAAGLLMVFIGFLLIRKTRRKPLKFLFITLMTLRLALWIFGLGVLAIVLGVAASQQQ
jgi:LPXTG-motif cell wall-anchored protein